jgi:thiol-disulfide isomerase/thioredoxin
MITPKNVSQKSPRLLQAVWGGAVALFLVLFVLRLPQPSTKLPDLSAPSFAGEVINLSVFKGNPLVINFWATWCGPCRRELSLFAAMAKTHPTVTFLFVNEKESREQIETFLQEENLSLEHVLLDTEGKLARRFKVFGLPSTFFFDAKGNVVSTQMGEVSSVQLFNALTDLTRP